MTEKKVNGTMYTVADLRSMADSFQKKKNEKEEQQGREELISIMSKLETAARAGKRKIFVNNLYDWTSKTLKSYGFIIKDNSADMHNEYEISGW